MANFVSKKSKSPRPRATEVNRRSLVEQDPQTIKDRIAALGPPSGITSYDVEFGADSEGEPAVWVIMYVENDADDTVTAATAFARRLQHDLLSRDYGRAWPYIRFKLAS